MKLLLDQNISFRVVDLIAGKFPNSKQVKDVGLEDSRDSDIWDYAKSNLFTIVILILISMTLALSKVLHQKLFG